MPTLPIVACLLVRTDFTDDAEWERVSAEATREYPPEGFRAYVEPLSDPGWADATWEAVRAAAPVRDSGPSVLFIADRVTLASPDHPILVVDLLGLLPDLVEEFPEVADRTPFRCIPAALWNVENNLNIANIDWDDFARSTGDDGVFRGWDG